MALEPGSKSFRYVILSLNCLMSFGTYFCFDMPGVLQVQFQGNVTCDNGTSRENSTCCGDCLGLTPDQFNLLYAVWSWTGACVVLFNGFLIDKIGNRAGALLFSSMAVTAAALFAGGSMPGLRGTPVMFPLLMLGRIIIGASSGSIRIVQDRLTSFWFKDKELAMAFGATVASSRLGSVLNFLFTESFALKFGLSWTLWGGVVLCGIGLLTAITVTQLDLYGTKRLGVYRTMKEESKEVRITEVKEFNLQFWLLTLSILFFYSAIIPFVADASLFIQEKYNIDEVTAGYTTGAVYDISIILSPILGYVADVYGGCGYISIASCVLAIPVFALLALTYIPPIACTLWLGVLYSLGAIGMWSRVPYLVERRHLGTAMGVVTCIQGLGMGLTNVAVGKILGNNNSLSKAERLYRWQLSMIPMGGCVIIASVIIIALNIVDKYKGGTLNSRTYKTGSDVRRTKEISPETEPLLDGQDGTSVN